MNGQATCCIHAINGDERIQKFVEEFKIICKHHHFELDKAYFHFGEIGVHVTRDENNGFHISTVQHKGTV